MHFFMSMIPPTVTAQEHRVMICKGKPLFYDSPEVADAKELLTAHLAKHKPESKIYGPVRLTVVWQFMTSSHKEDEWRTSKPDTDNLQKMLKDCMTYIGYWKDDAQVVWESVQKRWTRSNPGIFISIEELGDTA